MPRVGLTRDKLVATAMAMADESGLGSISLHSLARHYGVAAPSMYKHVRNLEDLHRSIAAEALILFERALRSADGSVEGLAHAYRNFAHDHPGLYETTQRPDLFATPEAQDGANRIASLFASALPVNMTADDTVDQVRIMRSALHGFVGLEQSGAFGSAANSATLDRSFQELCTMLTVLTTLVSVNTKTIKKKS